MKIYLLAPEEVVNRWSELSPLVQQALDTGQGENTLFDHFKKLINLQEQCWVIYDEQQLKGILLTEILQYTRHKTLHVITLSGSDFESWVYLYPTVEDFAKTMGCSAVEQWGRPGWAKVLPKLIPGFEQAYVVMRKNIGE